jgi:hypothetical protein
VAGRHGRSMAVLLTAGLEVLVASSALAVPGDVVWVATSDQGGERDRFAGSALSPDGSRLLVAGTSGGRSSADFRTIAYDALTGTEVWEAIYDRGDRDHAVAIAVAADGSALYVTGASLGVDSGADYATVAYETATGSQLWEAVYQSRRADVPSCIAVTPDGSTVLVTGDSESRRSSADWLTAAYDATTGARLWKRGYKTPRVDRPQGCSATADGSALVVTGYTYNVISPRGVPDVVTISYSVATGGELWRDRYDGRNGWDEGTDVAVGPDGVFVSGITNVGNNPDPLLLAYAPTGAMQWRRRFPSGGSWEYGTNLAVAPDGDSIYLTSEGGTMPTVAYDASSGATRWARRVGQTLGWAEGEAIAIAPDSMTVYVAGWWFGEGDDGALTFALNALTGETVWQDLSHSGSAWSVVAPPSGTTVLVSGDTYDDSLDYQTVAYEA